MGLGLGLGLGLVREPSTAAALAREAGEHVGQLEVGAVLAGEERAELRHRQLLHLVRVRVKVRVRVGVGVRVRVRVRVIGLG